MSPELQMLIESIDTRLESIDARTRAIETHVAEKTGGDLVKHRVADAARWIVTIVIAALTGHVAASH